MDPGLEIRKLPASKVCELTRTLDPQEFWKDLMNIIPENLERFNYECNVSLSNPNKYNWEDSKLIEDYCKNTGKSCTETLFEEWGTSGRVRPTIGHLFHLLKEACLFGAADYVADILGQPKPKRPDTGPAALIYVRVPETVLNKNTHVPDNEKVFDKSNDPHQVTGFKEAPSRMKERKILNERAESNMIIFSEEGSVQSVSDMMKFSEGIKTEFNKSISDMNISFKTVVVVADINHTANLPTLDKTGESLNFSESYTSSSSTPSFDELSERTSAHKPLNIPNFSIFDKSLEIIASKDESCVSLPKFSMLRQSDSQDLTPNPIYISHRKSENFVESPLTVLSLNTSLPHFRYLDLHVSTNNFNEGPYTGQSETGRLLGSGAFGSVFISFGLFDKPVAVKKLVHDNLKNVENVDVDDIIVKQFRNEVELGSKYEHENLLSLLGYSCDGCTFCLVYEYMQRGALKDNLQLTENKLQWKDRLKIAGGIARAVSYLHTAFETPLVHRDITSANILLDDKNSPKLCDFGSIKLLSKHHTYSKTSIFGTSAYMAPEVFNEEISIKMDTFSFGVVLLELLTSLPPMDGKREERDLWTHIKENCEGENILPLVDYQAGSWEENRVNFATELFEIALKCLEKKNRRPDMADVTVLLDELTTKMSE